jgi:hypothetical protein
MSPTVNLVIECVSGMRLNVQPRTAELFEARSPMSGKDNWLADVAHRVVREIMV